MELLVELICKVHRIKKEVDMNYTHNCIVKRICRFLFCIFALSLFVSIRNVNVFADNENGWVFEKGGWYLYRDGILSEKGFATFTDASGRTYEVYADAEGRMATDMCIKTNDYWYGFDEKGELIKKRFAGLYEEVYPTDRRHVGDFHYYYCDENGHVFMGKTKTMDGNIYYFHPYKHYVMCCKKPGTSIKKLPAYSYYPDTDRIISEIIKKAGIKSNMSEQKIIKKAYNYMVKNFKYSYEVKKHKRYHKFYTEQQVLDYEKKVAKKVINGKARYDFLMRPENVTSCFWEGDINYHEGVCNHFALIFTMILRRMNIDAGCVGGTIYKAIHAWNWVKTGGKTYYYDVGTAIHTYTRRKVVDYSYYKMTKNSMKGRYKISRKEYYASLVPIKY